jgi:hypothetical protein
MFHNYQLGERPLTVNMARPREERSGSGYGGSYSGGGSNRRRGGSRRY